MLNKSVLIFTGHNLFLIDIAAIGPARIITDLHMNKIRKRVYISIVMVNGAILHYVYYTQYAMETDFTKEQLANIDKEGRNLFDKRAALIQLWEMEKRRISRSKNKPA